MPVIICVVLHTRFIDWLNVCNLTYDGIRLSFYISPCTYACCTCTYTNVYMCTHALCLLFRVEKLGYNVPVFDFRLPGVTSMSADIHKYGLGIKVYHKPSLAVFVLTSKIIRCEKHCLLNSNRDHTLLKSVVHMCNVPSLVSHICTHFIFITG